MSEKEILSISPSGLNVFLSCPRKYHFKYTAHISEPELSEKTSLQWLGPNERGTMIHRAMELYVDQVICPLSTQLDTPKVAKGSVEETKLVASLDAISFLEEDFQTAWKQAVEEIESELQKKSQEAFVIPLLAKEKELAEAETDCRNAIQYMLEKMKERHQYPVRTEMKFGKGRDGEGDVLLVKRKDEEDFAICGSIDRVDYDIATGNYIVVDYKTGKSDKQRKLRKGGRDDLLQDRLYAYAFETLNPGKEVAASRYVFPAEDNQEIYETMTKAGKEAFVDRLWSEITKIRQKEDKACRGNEAGYPDCEATCRYCGYEELCIASDALAAEMEASD
ncbi:MAG: RecB family exonuclease [Lachnospiraceae bacterium]